MTINAVDVTTRVGVGGVLFPILINVVAVAGPGSYVLTGIDTTETLPNLAPNQFTFIDQINVQPGIFISSSALSPTGVTPGFASPITVAGGVTAVYRINGGAWANTAGSFFDGDSVEVGEDSSPGSGISTNTILTIGGVSDTFTTITISTSSMPFIQTFNEPFEDQNWESRGWYDYVEGGSTLPLVADGAIAGSTQSVQWAFTQGGTSPTNAGTIRKKVTPTDNIYISYYIKYSTNYVGSGLAFHPHEIYFLTNLSSDYGGLADTNMTAYVEQNALLPKLGIQDALNIDEANIGVDLRLTSENRAVAGCNSGSPPDPSGIGDCYGSGVDHNNGRIWTAPAEDVITVNVWHKVEAFFKMNTISGSVGQADGIARHWLDGKLVINETDIIFRTNANASMIWEQVVIAPFIGDGSPVAQSMLMDELVLGTGTVPVFDGFFTDGAWSTSFDYGGACTQRGAAGGTNCATINNDYITWSWGNTLIEGHPTEVTAAANNPNGSGGMGFRAWVGDGINVQSGDVRIDFPSAQPELWIRWYQRYQSGFAWANPGIPDYDKTIYIRTGSAGSVLPLHATPSRGFVIASQGSPEHYQADSIPTVKWADIFGTTSDGLFHMFEIHIKMDTNGTSTGTADGVARFWIDGILRVEETDVNYSGGNAISRLGWTWFEFHANQKTPANGAAKYVDYDDMAIYRVTPPATDSGGNAWIGPLNGFSGGA